MAQLRRSESELVKAKIDKYKVKFGNDQESFTGTDDQMLQLFEAEEAYALGDPILTDSEFDDLARSTGYQESLRAPVSSSGRAWIKMAAPLVSLRKILTIGDLQAYLRTFSPNSHFYVEPKLDGITFNAHYVRDGDVFKLNSVTSRGDGRFGLEMHENAFQGVNRIGLPDTIDHKLIGFIPGFEEELTIRGEVIMTKDEKRFEGKLLRSVASGMMNRKIPYMAHYRDIWSEEGPVTINPGVARGDGVPLARKATYEMKYGENRRMEIYENGELSERHTEALNRENNITFVSFTIAIDDANLPYRSILEILQDAGLVTVSQLVSEITNNKECIQGLPSDKVVDFINSLDPSEWRFPVDGMVIKPVDTSKESQGLKPVVKGGKIVYPHHPKDQVAYKFPAQKIPVKILKIHKTTTSIGNVTCSAELDQVYKFPSGTLVSRVNLHNERWLEANSWIQEGATLNLHLSHDIIPVLSQIS